MAKTYYGYKERSAESQINWAEVGKNFSDMLSEEVKVREDKKAAIDEASREYQKALNEVPQGQNGSIRTWALDFSSNAQEQMLMQERLLKSGLLKPKDYTVMRQNLVDGTDHAFTLVQKFQDLFDEKMQRMQDGESQLLESEIMESIEGFGNFKKSRLVINPETGNVSVGFFDKNGDLSKNPNDLRSISYLDNAIGMKFDKYKLEEVTSGFAKAQGAWEQVTRTLGSSQRKGIIEIISDPMRKKLTADDFDKLGIDDPALQEGINVYAEAEKEFITAQLANAYNTSSILTDYASAGYKFTYDKKDQGGKNILLTVDGYGRPVPEYTPEQKEDAARLLRNSIRNKISKTIQTTVVSDYTPTPQYIINQGKETREQQDILTSVANLYSGNQSEQDSAVQYLQSINPNIVKIDRTASGITIIFKDSTSKEISFGGMNERDFAIASTNFFLPSTNTMLNVEEVADSSNLGGAISPTSGAATAETTVPEKESFKETYEREVVNKIDGVIFEIDEDENTARSIRNIIASVKGLDGYTVKTALLAGNDEVMIYDKDNRLVMTFDLNPSDINPPTKTSKGTLEIYTERLRELVKSKATQEDYQTVADKRNFKKKDNTANTAPR